MLVTGLLKTPGSLLHTALVDDTWTLDQHLLAMVVDGLNILAWQKTKDGSKGRNRPKPVSPLAQKRGVKYGGGHGLTNDEVKARLAALNPEQYAGR